MFLEQFRGCFKRDVTFDHFVCYVVGLLAAIKRKSIEPIALAANVSVRTLQEFLAFFVWDDERGNDRLQRMVAAQHGSDDSIGVVDASAHPKSGDKTPGVQRQWCGRMGKVDNCVVGEHLLYFDGDLSNPFCCVLASDLFLPKAWSEDRVRCRAAKIPDELVHRPKWQIAVEQIEQAMGNGIRFGWQTFDEDYGNIPRFWFELDHLGQRGVGEVRKNFFCWPTLPKYGSLQGPFAAKRVDNVCRYSPAFTKQDWKAFTVKDQTRGPLVVQAKAALVHLVDASASDNNKSVPTDRKYWLIVVQLKGGELKYFVSNAPATTEVSTMLRVGFSRYHIEQWFRTAKQEAGFGSFEVRTYRSLIRHWFCSRLAMYFLAERTHEMKKKHHR